MMRVVVYGHNKAAKKLKTFLTEAGLLLGCWERYDLNYSAQVPVFAFKQSCFSNRKASGKPVVVYEGRS